MIPAIQSAVIPSSSPDCMTISAVTVGDGLSDAGHDLFRRHPIAPELAVARPEAAVVTLPDAAIGDLDQPPQVDFIPHPPAPYFISLPPEGRQFLRTFLAEPADNLPPVHRTHRYFISFPLESRKIAPSARRLGQKVIFFSPLRKEARSTVKPFSRQKRRKSLMLRNRTLGVSYQR